MDWINDVTERLAKLGGYVFGSEWIRGALLGVMSGVNAKRRTAVGD